MKKYNSIYLAGLLVLLVIFFISYSKYKMENDTISFGETVKVAVSKVSCNYGINKNYIVFHYNHSNHIANIDSRNCGNYLVGDSVNLLYNKEHDLFFASEIDTSSEKGGMLISGIFFLILILNLLFPKIIKLPNGEY